MATQAVSTASGWGAAVKAGYEYLLLDIETGNPPEAEIRAHFEATYEAPSNYKDPEKIAKHKEDAWLKARKRGALMPSAPIIAIGFKSETELRCLHAMKAHAAALRPVGGWTAMVEGFADQKGMLEAASLLMQVKVESDTVIAGFNIRDFDLPAIRRALARNRMPIPSVLLDPEIVVFDNMHKYCHLFSGSRDIMASCAEASVGLGITPHKVSGAVVPELYEAGEIESVIDKVLLDVLEEEQQFLRMTGRQ